MEKETLELIKESKLQIEYLHGKFQETGTGNAVLAKLNAFISKAESKQLNFEKMNQKLDNFLNSDEGEEFTKNYFDKIERKEKLHDLQLERFHKKFSNRFAELVEKVLAKYKSSEYIQRHYKRGYEPPEALAWFFYLYAKKYGRKALLPEWQQYANTFTDDLVYYGGYFFNQMNGQGSVIHIQKEGVDYDRHFEISTDI